MKNKLLFTILALCFLLTSTTFIQAQLSGSSAFMQGQYVELGINECGVYGSLDTPPIGPHGEYHPNDLNGLGFVCDSDKDGWEVGSPNYCGDYYTPGSPEEGWAIQYGDSVYQNRTPSCYGYQYYLTSDIPGAIVSYLDTLDIKEVIWDGVILDGDLDLSICQQTLLPDTAAYFTSKYTFINNGADSIIDLYFTTNIDPDQDQPWSGDFTTINSIISNPPLEDTALVTAVGISFGCYFSLSAVDTRARVSYGNFEIAPHTPEQAWNGDVTEGYYGEGLDYYADIAVQLTFKISIAPGDTESVSMARAFNSVAVVEALDFITPEIIVEDTVANEIEIFDVNDRITLFPNPATDGFNLEIDQLLQGNYQVQVIDTKGQLIFQLLNQTKAQQYISTKELAPGIYKIIVTSNEGTYTKSLLLE